MEQPTQALSERERNGWQQQQKGREEGCGLSRPLSVSCLEAPGKYQKSKLFYLYRA